MTLAQNACRLKIYIGESDVYEGHPLYEAIVLKARSFPLAGATVTRCPMGYGHSSHLHTAKILRLSEDLPVVIEIIDSKETIERFIPQLKQMMGSGLVTMENVQVVQYGHDDHPS